jgi:hypothetical protein
MRVVRFDLQIAARDEIEDAAIIAKLEEALNVGQSPWSGVEIIARYRKLHVKLAPINCQQCGKPFKPLRSTARYCSNDCRQAAFRIRPHSKTNGGKRKEKAPRI